MENVRVGQNENIDDDTRARAQKFVQSGTTRVFADPNRFSSPAAKPPIITLEQMKKEGFTDLRDYLNAKGNLKRRPDKVDPDMGAKADAAFIKFVKDRNQPAPAAAPTDVPVARSEVKNTSNDLRAKSKEQQARGAKLRGETSGVLGENAAKLEKEFKGSLNVADFLDSDSSTKKFAKGGSVSASRRGDGIAQRGKTRGQMC